MVGMILIWIAIFICSCVVIGISGIIVAKTIKIISKILTDNGNVDK